MLVSTSLRPSNTVMVTAQSGVWSHSLKAL